MVATEKNERPPMAMHWRDRWVVMAWAVFVYGPLIGGSSAATFLLISAEGFLDAITLSVGAVLGLVAGLVAGLIVQLGSGATVLRRLHVTTGVVWLLCQILVVVMGPLAVPVGLFATYLVNFVLVGLEEAQRSRDKQS